PSGDAEQTGRISARATRFARGSVSGAEYMDYRAQATELAELAAYSNLNGNLAGDGAPERVSAIASSPTMMPMLGVSPILGRWFAPEEAQVGRDQVMVLSYAYWQRRFGGDPHIIGKTVLLDRDDYQVIGVLPAGFWFPADGDLWVPLTFRPDDVSDAQRGNHSLSLLARLKPGV